MHHIAHVFLLRHNNGGDLIALGKDMGLNSSHLVCVGPRAVSLVFVGWRMHLSQTNIG